MRNSSFCIYENQGLDSLRGNPASDQHICFSNIDYTIPQFHGDSTIITLSFRTYSSEQTVQTQIRLLLEEQSDQGLHCSLFHLHLLDKIPWGLASVWVLGSLQQSSVASENLGTLLYIPSSSSRRNFLPLAFFCGLGTPRQVFSLCSSYHTFFSSNSKMWMGRSWGHVNGSSMINIFNSRAGLQLWPI